MAKYGEDRFDDRQDREPRERPPSEAPDGLDEGPPADSGGAGDTDGGPPAGETPAQRYKRMHPPTAEAPAAPAPRGLPPKPGTPADPGNNSPLAIPGTFARPGEEGSAPFRTAAFNQNRIVGQAAGGFTPGGGFEGRYGGAAPLVGGDMSSLPFGSSETGIGSMLDDEALRRAIAQGLFGG